MLYTLKQALNDGLELNKYLASKSFNQKGWIKTYIDINAELRKKKNDFDKIFNLMDNLVFRKTMENVRNHRDINLVTTETRGVTLTQITLKPT